MRGGLAYVQAGGRHRRRQRSGFRGSGDPAQGAGRAAGAGARRDAAAGGRRARLARAVTDQSAPAETEAEQQRSLPRSAVLAALGIAAGVVVVLVASSPTWLRVTLRSTHTDVTLTGRALRRGRRSAGPGGRRRPHRGRAGTQLGPPAARGPHRGCRGRSAHRGDSRDRRPRSDRARQQQGARRPARSRRPTSPPCRIWRSSAAC